MKALVISKPIYDYIMPLVEFPQDGDSFFIEKTINSLSSYGTIAALTLGKYGVDVSYTGMVGNDDVGPKIKEILENYQVDTKYLEVNYEEKTCVSYKIYNTKSNKFTNINSFTLKSNLTKYKYEFIPDVVIMDDRDYNANNAALNNFPNSLTIFIGDKFTKESQVYCKRCKYIICSLSFASEATGIVNGLNKPKNIVAMYQKFIDLYSANLIIKLDNFDMLYCVNDEVRLIKNVNNNFANKDSIYYSLISYFLINNYNIEDSIKLTNKVMLSSPNDVDIINDIPDYKVITSSLEELKKVTTQVIKSTGEIKEQTVTPINNNVNVEQNTQTQQVQNQTQTQQNTSQTQPVQNQQPNPVQMQTNQNLETPTKQNEVQNTVNQNPQQNMQVKQNVQNNNGVKNA